MVLNKELLKNKIAIMRERTCVSLKEMLLTHAKRLKYLCC